MASLRHSTAIARCVEFTSLTALLLISYTCEDVPASVLCFVSALIVLAVEFRIYMHS